jgi:hypothetical protein
MRRQLFAGLIVSLALLLSSSTVKAAENEEFGWTIVSGTSQSNMGQLNPRMIQDLRHRYGDRFLVIRDGDEKYVITDEALVRRGEDITSEIRNYQPEIGDMAEAEARLSLSKQNHEEEKVALKERRRKIRTAIENNERRGRPTRALERDLFQATVQLQAIQGLEENSRLSADEERRLMRQRERASARLKVGTDRINREMRELLDTAKSSGRAERLQVR